MVCLVIVSFYPWTKAGCARKIYSIRNNFEILGCGNFRIRDSSSNGSFNNSVKGKLYLLQFILLLYLTVCSRKNNEKVWYIPVSTFGWMTLWSEKRVIIDYFDCIVVNGSYQTNSHKCPLNCGNKLLISWSNSAAALPRTACAMKVMRCD